MQGKKLTIEYIRKQFENKSCKLLSTEYINSRQKLEYVCSNGHRNFIAWNKWQQNRGCSYCSNKAKKTIEFIRSEFAKEDYKLLTKEYINNEQKLDYVCSEGHKHSITWANWITGYRCPECYRNRQGDSHRLSFDYVKKNFENENYKLLIKKYKNAFQKLNYICPKGHRHSITWAMWQQGQRCSKCSNNISKWEIEVKKFLDDSNINYVPNDRTQLINPNTGYKLELDIWMPELSKAIECNGIYWHIDNGRESSDNVKRQLCKDKNIDLLVVTDKEWNRSMESCKSKIINFVKN